MTSSPGPRTVILWDIDNTLLYTGGAGSLAMARAFERLHGIPDAFSSVEFSGRSDMAIFRDAARAHDVAHDDRALAAFIDAYLPEMRRALAEKEGSLMPGVIDLLEALEDRADVVSGLGTGNFRCTGQAKVEHYGIGRFFPDCVGGFGDDHESRDELIRAGIGRLRASPEDRVVVIGDTPHDVAAARANGAFALAVATGRDSTSDLRACGADAALEDLADTAAVLALLFG